MSATILDRPRAKGTTAAILAGASHRIGGVNLVVHDLDRVADFYAEVIGLAVLDRSEDGARLGVGDVTLVELRRDPTARRSTLREAGLFHAAFLLPERANLSAWLRHAASLRVELAGASDHLVSEALYLADPEGNGIEIYVDRPASTWPREGGRIVIATERLDLSGLAGASDRPWLGFPVSGQIGHVHLQVGDLSTAEAFYRGVLGFDVTGRRQGALFYGLGGYHHQLASNVWNRPRCRGALGRRDGPRRGRDRRCPRPDRGGEGARCARLGPQRHAGLPRPRRPVGDADHPRRQMVTRERPSRLSSPGGRGRVGGEVMDETCSPQRGRNLGARASSQTRVPMNQLSFSAPTRPTLLLAGPAGSWPR